MRFAAIDAGYPGGGRAGCSSSPLSFACGRLFVAACMVRFALAGLAPPVLLVLGTIDIAGALWTAAALRRADWDRRSDRFAALRVAR